MIDHIQNEQIYKHWRSLETSRSFHFNSSSLGTRRTLGSGTYQSRTSSIRFGEDRRCTSNAVALDSLKPKKTIAYARVSSRDQKADLERQAQVLEMFCAQNGWQYEVITDLGSGMNYRKKGLTRLLNLLISGEVGRLVITHKDRLLRFGAELVFSVCEMKSVESHHQSSSDSSFEEDWPRMCWKLSRFSARDFTTLAAKRTKNLLMA